MKNDKFNKKRRGNGRQSKSNSSQNKFSKNTKYEDENATFPGNGKVSDNDWRWYASSEQLLRDTASLPYTTAVGAELQLGQYADGLAGKAIPGICSIEFGAIYGNSGGLDSAINVAAHNLYTLINSRNSRNMSYDPSDLMYYLMAMDQANMFLAWMKRAYGVANLTSVYNRYTPTALLNAMGISTENWKGSSVTRLRSVTNQLSDFRAYINSYAMKLSSMCIPTNMPIFRRHEWLCENVYLDRVGIKSQMYVLNPAAIGIIELNDGTWKLNYHTFHHYASSNYSPFSDSKRLLTLDDIITMGNTILSSILYTVGEQDFNIISADILKCYGPEGVHVAQMIDEKYSVYPVYNEEVLTQIQNLRVFPATYDEIDSSLDNAWSYHSIVNTTNNTEYISGPAATHEFTTEVLQNPYLMNPLITLPMDSPTPADTMVATRLIAQAYAYLDSNTGFWNLSLIHAASEVVIGFRLVRMVKSQDENTLMPWGSELLKTIVEIPLSTNTTVSTTYKAILIKDVLDSFSWYSDNYGWLSNFDWHPLIYMAAYNPDSNPIDNVQPQCIGGDVANYTTTDWITIDAMNTTAMLSLMGIENFGLASNFDKH